MLRSGNRLLNSTGGFRADAFFLTVKSRHFKCSSVQVLVGDLGLWSLIGNSVRIGDGPAAVIGDERRIHVTVHSKLNGKTRLLGRSDSQKTCLDMRRTLYGQKAARLILRIKRDIPGSNSIGPGIFIWPGPSPFGKGGFICCTPCGWRSCLAFY